MRVAVAQSLQLLLVEHSSHSGRLVGAVGGRAASRLAGAGRALRLMLLLVLLLLVMMLLVLLVRVLLSVMMVVMTRAVIAALLT